MPGVVKRSGQRRTCLWFRTPHRERGREGSRDIASTEGEAAAQEIHVGMASDVAMPPSGIGACGQEEHHRPGPASFGFLARLISPLTKSGPADSLGP